MAGILCISLDTEYFWGVHHSKTIEKYGKNVAVARRIIIPGILKLFRKYSIHATWAVVGAAMAKNVEEMETFLPPRELRPTYSELGKNPYRLLDSIKKNREMKDLFFAYSDIAKIEKCRYQEIGTHSFTHYFCKEKGQTIEQFRADIEAAKRIAEKNGLTIESMVFPKLQYGPNHLDIVHEMGIRVMRGKEDNWISNSNLPIVIKRILGLVDTYIPISEHNCHIPRIEHGIVDITGSRFYRAYNPVLFFLEPLKSKRIKRQMEYAAMHDLVFHLWWHPHNFGNHAEKNLKDLEKILKYYKYCEDKYGMKSLNMAEVARMFQP